MYQQTKIIFLFLFLWLVQKTQAQNGKRAENTILKLKNDQNPYSKGQTKWLIKNGFDAQSYDWQNPNINSQLDLVLDRRTSGVNVWVVVALASGIWAVDRIIEDRGGKVFFLSVSLSSAIISHVNLRKARKQIKQINIWQEYPNQLDSITVEKAPLLSEDFHLYSPYKPSQNKYLTSHGFDIHQYDWSNQEINLYLKRSLQSRNTSNVLLGVGTGLFVLNLGINAIGYIINDLSDDPDKGEYDVATALYWLGGGMIGTSIAFKIRSKKMLQKANRMN